MVSFGSVTVDVQGNLDTIDYSGLKTQGSQQSCHYDKLSLVSFPPAVKAY
jgi:hypothetical protein